MRGKKSDVGETKYSPNGYHYTRTGKGWELTGRMVAAERLGRPLESNERIRYRDGDRRNNSPDNIEVYETGKGTNAKRRARIEARIAELQAEIEEIEELEGE